mmetsp:Transcript_26468/g.71516  ORF Transcript_26468/g.71516 Transcript_26468/m.71516 type:complete len:323 (-) Transcript_26468:868-1836(-)
MVASEVGVNAVAPSTDVAVVATSKSSVGIRKQCTAKCCSCKGWDSAREYGSTAVACAACTTWLSCKMLFRLVGLALIGAWFTGNIFAVMSWYWNMEPQAEYIRTLERLNTSESFADLGQSCVISRVVGPRSETITFTPAMMNGLTRNESFCYDIYVYLFVHGNKRYRSRAEFLLRTSEHVPSNCTELSEELAPKNSSLKPGQQVNCWKLIDDKGRDDGPYPGAFPVHMARSFPYQCNNDDCFKIFDPEEERDNAVREAQGWLTKWIIAPLFVAIPCACASTFVFFWAIAATGYSLVTCDCEPVDALLCSGIGCCGESDGLDL